AAEYHTPLFRPPVCYRRLHRIVTPSSCRAPRCAGEDLVRRFFADHVHRTGDEEARNARKDRGVNDAQSARAMHGEILSKNPVALSRADRATARGMVPPGVVTDIVGERGVRLNF